MDDGFNKLGKLILIALSLSSPLALGLYFYTFNGELSAESQDWAHFGSFAGGVVTLPVTVVTLILVYKNYKIHKKNYNETLLRNFENSMIEALNLCVDDLDRGLNSMYVNTTEGLFTYADAFCIPRLYQRLCFEVSSNAEDEATLRMKIGKKLIALYDLLVGYEVSIGRTEVVRSVKIRYQSYFSSIDNDMPSLLKIKGKSSKEMKDFFYEIDLDLSNTMQNKEK